MAFVCGFFELEFFDVRFNFWLFLVEFKDFDICVLYTIGQPIKRAFQ
jgi:hypothetical protein